jgi:5-methylcytosine-specific restriction endonuclease McrBC GTP-binding regulatory subunit McrB
MSIDGVDLDTDLVNEYFMAESASRELPMEIFKAADSKICEELLDPEEKKQCEQLMELHDKITKFRKTNELYFCPEEYKEDCIVLDMLTKTTRLAEGKIGQSTAFANSYHLIRIKFLQEGFVNLIEWIP